MKRMKWLAGFLGILMTSVCLAVMGSITSHRFRATVGETISDFPLVVDGTKFKVRKDNDSGDVFDVDVVNSKALVSGDFQTTGRTAFGNDGAIGITNGYDKVFDFSQTI